MSDLHLGARIHVLTGDGAAQAIAHEVPGAGAIEEIAFSPHDPALVLAGRNTQSDSSIWRSTDAGDSWTEIPLVDGRRIVSVSWAPFVPGRALALAETTTWMETLDEGLTWSVLQQLWFAGGVGALVAFDPFEPGVLYRAIEEDGFHSSDDGGAMWTFLGQTAHHTSDLQFHPDSTGLIFASDGWGNVAVSADRGGEWALVYRVDDGRASALALDPTTGALLVGTTTESVVEVTGASPYTRVGPGTLGDGGFVPRHVGVGLPSVGRATWGLAGEDVQGGVPGNPGFAGTTVVSQYATIELPSLAIAFSDGLATTILP